MIAQPFHFAVIPGLVLAHHPGMTLRVTSA
jgi:hypothetical protein